MKNMIKSSLVSTGMATLMFCIIGICFDIMYDGNFELTNYSFTKMVIGCIVIGLGYGMPTFIYSNEKLPLVIKGLFHMGIGTLVYTATSLCVGWIPAEIGIGKGILILLGQIAIAFAIWFCYFMNFKKQVKLMNTRIKELENK